MDADRSLTRRAASWWARRAGAFVIVAAYLAVVVATMTLSGHRVLPLFEGVGPPPAYQWVHPPPQFAQGNVTPRPIASDIPFTAGRTGQSGAATPDGQFTLNFGAGAFAPHDADTSVHAAITPLDPATLGPVPPGLAADGNVYRLQLSYRPSNTPVDTLAVAGNVIMTAPHAARALLYSADGQSWTKLATQTFGGPSTVGSTLTRPGWYLMAASPSAVAPGRHNRGLGIAVIAALVAGLAVVLAVTPIALRAIRQRRQRPRARPPQGPAPRATRPPRRSRGR